MNKIELNKAVGEVCKKYNWTKPKPWVYPGDLVFDNLLKSFFICGDHPKDVAELRRRSNSFKKVNLEDLKQFLIARQ